MKTALSKIGTNVLLLLILGKHGRNKVNTA
jgi:hypothetical protein